jgi:hypothetical protein
MVESKDKVSSRDDKSIRFESDVAAEFELRHHTLNQLECSTRAQVENNQRVKSSTLPAQTCSFGQPKMLEFG